MASKLIYGEEDRLVPWAEKVIGVKFRRDAYTIGLERNGEVVCVCVYDSFSECDCSMHIASDGSSRFANKEFVVAVFAYPFLQLGLRRVTAMVPAKNERALKLDEHLGFVREGRHPHACQDDDLISLGMLRENCRFIPTGGAR